MANKKLLITSRGCYAVSDDGVTVELADGKEVVIDDTQAAVFLRSGKAQLVINKQQHPTKKSK